jgi:hypothetical protein
MTISRIYSILLRCVVGGIAGLFVAMLLKTNLEHVGEGILEILGAPAFRFYAWWHSIGLPPQSAGPFFAFFIQWIILGVIVGILSGFRRAGSQPD